MMLCRDYLQTQFPSTIKPRTQHGAQSHFLQMPNRCVSWWRHSSVSGSSGHMGGGWKVELEACSWPEELRERAGALQSGIRAA